MADAAQRDIELSAGRLSLGGPIEDLEGSDKLRELLLGELAGTLLAMRRRRVDGLASFATMKMSWRKIGRARLACA